MPNSTAQEHSTTNNHPDSYHLEQQAAPESAERTELVPVKLPIGSVRVSLGYLSTFENVYAFVEFLLATFRDEKAIELVTSSAHELELSWPVDAYC